MDRMDGGWKLFKLKLIPIELRMSGWGGWHNLGSAAAWRWTLCGCVFVVGHDELIIMLFPHLNNKAPNFDLHYSFDTLRRLPNGLIICLAKSSAHSVIPALYMYPMQIHFCNWVEIGFARLEWRMIYRPLICWSFAGGPLEVLFPAIHIFKEGEWILRNNRGSQFMRWNFFVENPLSSSDWIVSKGLGE